MSETASGPGEQDRPPPQGQDMEGLKEQFEQQQAMIAQLKEMLHSNEQQLANKGKEVEEYATKLSNIKTRSKTSKRISKTTETKKVEEEGPSSEAKSQEEGSLVADDDTSKKQNEKKGSKGEKSRHGNLTLLRKKLEENRMKFEQRGKEMSANKGIEEMVENLRTQVEERDHIIQTLQKNLESKPVVESSGQEVASEPQAWPQESISNEYGDTREMYAQIVYKDNKILELNNRIMELEVHVLDLQENLKEKDAVIDARTKAITLMSEDMSRKSKSTLDTLDDTREQMRLMQNNFITLEGRMKDEKDQLNKQLEERERKIKQMEENNKKMESVRFDLTTRIAELQEKVVNLQSLNSELHKQAEYVSKQREHKGGSEERIEELMRALEDSNKQMIKVKAQHKNKVKSLTKQVESLKKVSDSNEEIVRLQQRVAELEEDKGNLQLHLVDFDELKATEDSWKRRIREMEGQINQLNQDLDSHVHALSMLENEKLTLIEDLQNETKRVSQLDAEVTQLKSSALELEKLKVTAEMKAVELEEQVDLLSQEKSELQRDNNVLSEDRSELKHLLDALQQEKTEMQEEIMNLQAQVREGTNGDNDSNRSEFQMVSSNNSDEEKWKRLSASEEALAEEKHVKDSSNAELSLKLLEAELDDARKVISEQKEIINDLNLKLESREVEIEMQQEVISKLEQLGQEVGLGEEQNLEDANRLSEILKDLNEMTGDLEEWKNRCSEVEDRLKLLENEKTGLQSRLEEVTDENSLLSTQLKLQKEVTEDLASKVKEQNEIVSEKDEGIRELQNLAQESPQTAVEETEERAQDSVVGVRTLQDEVNRLQEMCTRYESELNRKETEVVQATHNLEQAMQSVTELHQEVHLREVSTTEKELLQEKELTQGKEDTSHQVIILEEKIQELTSLVESKTKEISAKEEELEKISRKLKNLKEKAALNLKAKIVVIQNLEEKEREYENIIKEKEAVISSVVEEKEMALKELESRNAELEPQQRAFNALSEKYVTMETELRAYESQVEELTARNKYLSEENGSLSNSIIALKQESEAERRYMEEQRSVLESKAAEWEREINVLQIEVRNKSDEISFLNEQQMATSSLEEERTRNEEIKEQIEKKNQELIGEIMKKEEEITEVSLKLEELSKDVIDKNLILEASAVKFKELEQVIISKDMQMNALEDRISGFQHAYSALEAKLQEREAVVESLEQEIAKSQSREQHLEEGLSGIEERRRSLEDKYLALGEQLQQQDLMKQEHEEHEGLLEHRLAALASSEVALRKKMENIAENKAELQQRISELSAENEEMKRDLANAESHVKSAYKEIERLTPCESEYSQALETIERLQHTMKVSAAEFERTSRAKAEETRQYIESLENDMRNLNVQVETLETEKRALMEHCEKINDIKFNLEEEVEAFQERSQLSNERVAALEKSIADRETEFTNILEEKKKEVLELRNGIEILKAEMQNKSSTSSVQVQTPTSNAPETSEDTSQMKHDLESLKVLLSQKDTEIQSYQTRLLQLQFGSGDDSSGPIFQEAGQSSLQHVKDLEESLKIKDYQIEELRSLLESANVEMSQLQQHMGTSCRQIEEMSGAMTFLQEEVRNKDAQLQMQMEEISSMASSSKLSQQLECIDTDYQTHVVALERQNEKLYQALLEEKAKHVVSDVIAQAREQAEERSQGQSKARLESSVTGAEGDVEKNVEEASARNRGVQFQFPIEPTRENEETISPPSMNILPPSDISGLTQELAEKLGDLRAELDAVKDQRTSALMQVEQLQVEVDRLYNVEKLFSELQMKFDSLATSGGSAPIEHDFSKESSVETAGERGDSYLNIEERTGMTTLGADYGAAQSDRLTAEGAERGVGVVDGESPWAEVVGEEGEGWGWGSEEARLEEEHMQKQQAALFTSEPLSGDQQFINELKYKIEELEVEKERLLEELKASQVRSGKMLKKFKDLKLKNESLMRENTELALKKGNDFGGLDLAIEEELKIRIDSLEKELRECKGERETIKTERDVMQRRVESLSAANERLAERERQVDTEYWQNKNKELLNQVETLQWKIGELMEEKSSSEQQESSKEKYFNWDAVDSSADKSSNVQEMQDQIAALAADNEQLQSMLEEQRNLRVAAEAALRDLEHVMSSKESGMLQEMGTMREECMALRESYQLACKELEQLRSNIVNDSLLAENTTLRENYAMLYREVEQLRSTSNSDLIAAEYSSMRENYEVMYNEMEKLRAQVDINNTAQANYESLQMAHDQLISEMSELQKVYCSLNDTFEAFKTESELKLRESLEKMTALQQDYELRISILEERATMQQDHEQRMGELLEERTTMQQDYEQRTVLLHQERTTMQQDYEQKMGVLHQERAAMQQDYEQRMGLLLEERTALEKNYEQRISVLLEEKEGLHQRYNEVATQCSSVLQELQHTREENEKNKKYIEEIKTDHTRLNETNSQMQVNTLSSYFGGQSLFPAEETQFFDMESGVPSEHLAQSVEKETCTDQILTTSATVQTFPDESENIYQEQLQQCHIKISQLTLEVQEKVKEIEVLREMLYNEQQQSENTQQELIQKIGLLQTELEMVKEASLNESEVRENLMVKEHELSIVKSQLSYAEETLSKTQGRIDDLEARLLQKEEDIQNSNRNAENQENMIQQIVTAKEQELRNLQEKLAEKEHEQRELMVAADKDVENLKKQISDHERQIEELMFVKDQDIQNLRIQMSEIEERLKETVLIKDRDIHKLEEELSENSSLIDELTQSLRVKEREVRDLQDALEAREDEISEAVLQIRDKNLEIQQLQSPDQSSATRTDNAKAQAEEQSESSESNELDLALYMLHQRDMRCEELTLELMQLLEERDTLQLRLSTAIKINEELRNKINKASATSSPLRASTSLSALHLSPSTSTHEDEHAASTEEPEADAGALEEPKEDLQALANKLSQLHSVDYRRDVTLHDDREQRHSEQMMLLQQRGSGVLVESNYTLSRDVQSPSTVLLNWIWGRSTPKVMHI